MSDGVVHALDRFSKGNPEAGVLARHVPPHPRSDGEM